MGSSWWPLGGMLRMQGPGSSYSKFPRFRRRREKQAFNFLSAFGRGESRIIIRLQALALELAETGCAVSSTAVYHTKIQDFWLDSRLNLACEG